MTFERQEAAAREQLLEILHLAIEGLCASGPCAFTVCWDELTEGGLIASHECLIQTTYRDEDLRDETEIR